MYEDNKNYIAPSVTVLGQENGFDQVNDSGDVNWGIGDNIFDED